MTPQPSEQPRTQSEQAAMADAQWKQDSRLRQVLNAWDHGPEFIESLLGWGFRIEAEAAAPDPVVSPQSAMFCGKCQHPMHWRECGADADLTAPCQCRNDVAIADPVASPPDPRTWPLFDDAVEALAAEIFTEIPRALPWTGAAKVAKENCREQARQRFGEVAGLLNAESRTVREYIRSLWPVATPAPLDDMEGALHYALGHMNDDCECDRIWADIHRFHESSVEPLPAYSLEGQPVAEEPEASVR